MTEPRKLTFRVWDEHNRQMFEHLDLMGAGYWEMRSPGVSVVMQYTGLKDKNGVCICEGDILERHGSRCVCEWEPETAGFWIAGPKLISAWPGIEKEAEVIGNIYQNPELLQLSQSR